MPDEHARRQKPVVGIITVLDSRAAAAAASLLEWGTNSSFSGGGAAAAATASAASNPAAQPSLGSLALALSRRRLPVATGGVVAAAAAAADDEGVQRPATVGVYLRLAWTVGLGVLDVGLTLLLLVWPDVDPLCGGAEGGYVVFAALLAGAFVHVLDMVRGHPLV
jgi:hypothetical protein